MESNASRENRGRTRRIYVVELKPGNTPVIGKTGLEFLIETSGVTLHIVWRANPALYVNHILP